MKRSILSAMLTIVLIVGNLPFIAQSSPGNLAPPPPITPTPTSTPLSLAGMSQENPTPPTPGEFRDQVEQTRARQAMEAALAKYLRYWGPRYQVAPIEVTVEGEWAHGVAEWQSQTRTLSGPIHILAHRLPDGTWQALMPSTEGAYLQWLEAIPERLVPAGELNQLRAQAAEADALLRPQAAPAVPPAPTVMLPSKEGLSGPIEPVPGLAQPTATPTPFSIRVSIPPGTPTSLTLPSQDKSWNILSDGQFVFGPNVGNFDLTTYLRNINSPLLDYADVIEIQCAYASVNPRVVLALIEIQSGLVRGNSKAGLDNPIGYAEVGFEPQVKRLIVDAATNFYQHLYAYGSRSKTQSASEITFQLADGNAVTLPANISSGSYAIVKTLAPLSTSEDWLVLSSRSSPSGFVSTYRELFPDDDPLDESNQINPTSAPPADLLQFPFPIGASWWFNGPHNWNGGGYGPPYSSMDFGTSANSCSAPPAGDWSVAAASGNGYHPSGYSCWFRIDHGSGWTTSYYHLRNVRSNGGINRNESVGTIACETCAGGWASGPHVHFSLLYNGAYTDLDGTKLSGWTIHVGNGNYNSGYIERNGQVKYPFNYVYNDGIPSGDTTDPDGDITSPSEGATVSSRTVHLAGWGSDSQSGFNHAHFTAYYNGSWRQVGQNFTSSPFGFDWDMCNDGVPNGSVTIGLDIWDNAGNEANSPHGVRHFTKNYDCSPPPSCNPSADQIALYANTGYGGSCVTLGVGNYPNPGYLGSLGNDNAESIKVGSNVQAILYEHDNYQGRSETFTSNDSNLGDNYIGANTVSSVKVQWRAQLPAAPTLQSPANGSTFNEGQGINLSWSATGNEYYGEIWGGPGGTLTFGWQSGTSKNIGSQWAGYTYSWHVKARNGAGESGWSSTWTFTVKPAAPSNLSAQATSCNQVTLYWTDNSGNEEGYKIYRNSTYIGQVGINATSYQDTGLSENTTYSYYVRAFRGSIESDTSNTVNVTTPTCAPPQPDLRPYARSGYPYPVVPSSVQGTHEVNTLYAGRPTYFDWYFINSGNATASGNFHVELWVDDTRYVRYPFSNWGSGWVDGFDDWMETISAPGWHTVRLITDPDNTIAESDETNNAWESQFYWTPTAPYFDDMESGTNGWTATGLWHQVDFIGPDGWRRWWYGQDSTNNYDTGAANSGDLTSPPLYIPSTGYYLRFLYYYETETQGTDWDQRWVQISVDGGPFNNVLQLYDDPMVWWLRSQVIDLSGYAGHTIQVRFHFDTIDDAYNDYSGWYIDNFDISATPPPSCADTHESNNTPTLATDIAYGQTLNADICPGGDYDYYRFTGTAGDRIVVDIDTSNESWLDSYVFLLDSDGTSVLAENDDEVSGVRDSHLGYHLPHDGTYYIKVKAWNHPSAGGTEYFYTIHLLVDEINPSTAEITSPGNDAWLHPNMETVAVTATDNESGINRVEFLWHDADWQNSDWIWLGADNDGRDGWSWDFDTSSLPDQRGGAFYIWAFDWAGNWTGAGTWNLGLDRTSPTASTYVSPMYGDAPFRDFHVWWNGDDNLSGIAGYDVQYRDGVNGVWTNLVTGTTDTYYRFVVRMDTLTTQLLQHLDD